MSGFVLIISAVGAFAFGVVIGWVTYRTLRRSSGGSSISDIGAVIGAVGGAAVSGLFPRETGAFGFYCLGLALGFFGYLATAVVLAGRTGQLTQVNEWLGEAPWQQARPEYPQPQPQQTRPAPTTYKAPPTAGGEK